MMKEEVDCEVNMRRKVRSPKRWAQGSMMGGGEWADSGIHPAASSLQLVEGDTSCLPIGNSDRVRTHQAPTADIDLCRLRACECAEW